MKDYMKPELELVVLMTEENITSGDDFIDGEMGDESSIF